MEEDPRTMYSLRSLINMSATVEVVVVAVVAVEPPTIRALPYTLTPTGVLQGRTPVMYSNLIFMYC